MNTKKLNARLLFFFLIFSIATYPAIAQEDDDFGDTYESVDDVDADELANSATDGLNAAQDIMEGGINPNGLSSMVGFTKIGGENYIGMRIQPTLQIWKIGLGLDVPLMFNVDNGKLRTDEFKDGVGALRMLRFIRYGHKKKDAFYARFGTLDNAYLGFGGLLNNYTNSVSFDKRKMGFEFDFRIKKVFGLEVLYSDVEFHNNSLMGVRPYYRPLGATSIPILNTFEIGAQYVQDHDKLGSVRNVTDSTSTPYKYLDDGIKAYGFDAGVNLVNTSFFKLSAFASHSVIMKVKSDSLKLHLGEELYNKYDDGSGTSVGLESGFSFLGNVVRLNARIERLWYSDNFIPQFFDVGYELNKDEKILGLAHAKGKQGIYGSLGGSVLGKVFVKGALLMPDGMDEETPGIFKLTASAPDLFGKFFAYGSYTKTGLEDLGETFGFDSRSIARARLAYKMYKFLAVGVDYKLTWSPDENGDMEHTYTVMPYVGLSVTF